MKADVHHLRLIHEKQAPGASGGFVLRNDRSAEPAWADGGASSDADISITYEVAEVRITQFQLQSERMFLVWTGGTAPYRVERAENILGPWTAVTAASNQTQATAPMGGEFAYYRVVSGPP